MQHTMVPSGITPMGRMLPICRTAFLPAYTNCPVYIPSQAMKVSVLDTVLSLVYLNHRDILHSNIHSFMFTFNIK